MYLDEIVAAQKRGEARGVTSVCSAHPYVIQQTLKVFAKHPRNEVEGAKTFKIPPLIEATCNQVNQYGGYTGMTPGDFVLYVHGIAGKNNFPFENIILGGDHLGPNVWQNEPAESAMQKSEVMIRDYVQAGFTKIHLDCSMRLADDPQGALDVEVSVRRAARLAKIAEEYGNKNLRYVIGTEVPIPGGAMEHEEGVSVTTVEDARQTIEVTRETFLREGLAEAWARVMGVVVQPGVEFGDDFVLPYHPEAARELSKFIENQPMIYEAHSTDYQTRDALKNLVHDHFAILKVGPGLTFAFREAVFALAMIENELIEKDQRSNIIEVLDEVMVTHPEPWKKHYHGTEEEIAYKRKYSLSDRIRYYWADARTQHALTILIEGLRQVPWPDELLKQFLPEIHAGFMNAGKTCDPEKILLAKIRVVLDDYYQACNPQ